MRAKPGEDEHEENGVNGDSIGVATNTRDATLRYNPTGTVVLLVTGESDRGWAARSAMDLCAGWAASGRRIVLADLHVDTPLLGNADTDDHPPEGIVDLFEYGASLSRIARPAADRGFYFIPAGTYTPDPAAIYRHSRWKKLAAGSRDTGATLLLLVPAEEGLAELGRWSAEAILLGSAANETTRSTLERSGIGVLGSIEAPADAASPLTEPANVGSPGDESNVALAPEVERFGAVAAEDLDLPPPPPRTARDFRRVAFVGGLVLLAVVITVAYLIAALAPRGGDEETSAGAGASREGELLPYSVQVKAFPALGVAREQLAIEQGRLNPVPFFISPEEIQGVLYFRILAGLAPDTVAAARLRDRLVEIGALETGDPITAYGLVQYTPLAFDLGVFPTREEALMRMDSLFTLDVPSYASLVPYSDGSRRWQLYGGAYRDSQGAERMRTLLDQAGVAGELTVRAGIPDPPIE